MSHTSLSQDAACDPMQARSFQGQLDIHISLVISILIFVYIVNVMLHSMGVAVLPTVPTLIHTLITMQTKKRPTPLACIVNEAMEKSNLPVNPVPKRPKKSYPSERVKAPKSLHTGSDILSLKWEIGKGTFSKCYYAISEYTNSVFAVKTQRLKGCSNTTMLRVEREMAIHKSASGHAAITKFISTFEDGNNLYFQLELCSNGDLNSYIKSHGSFSPIRAWELMKQVASGVEYLHSYDILHRDLKMANIFLTSELVPKIGDFGLAYQLPQGENRKFGRAGTPAYMAPELCYAPHVCSKSSDIWAFGVLWFGIIYGVLPFNSTTTEGTTKLVGKGVFTFPESPAVPEEFEALIKRILCTRSCTRPTAPELVIIFQNNLFQRPHKSKSPTRVSENSHMFSPSRIAGVAESLLSPRLPKLKSFKKHSGHGIRLPALLSRKDRSNTLDKLDVLEEPPAAARPGSHMLQASSMLSHSPNGGIIPLIARYRM